jgi:hypothetical protein
VLSYSGARGTDAPRIDGSDHHATSLLATCLLIPAIPTAPCKVTLPLSFALRINGGKCVHDAGETMARITAERPVEHLERSGYVIMCKPPLGQHGAPGNLAGWIEKATKLGQGESGTARCSTPVSC